MGRELSGESGSGGQKSRQSERAEGMEGDSFDDMAVQQGGKAAREATEGAG